MCRLSLALFFICLPLGAGNTYGKLPLSFEPNRGQTEARVKFLARIPGYTLYVTSDEAVFAGRDGSVERMKLLGASRKMRIEPLDKQPGISNYFIGNDPAKWRTNVANYGRVALREVYPGIDLIFYSNERQLEYDWVVAPGVDPRQIRVRWNGAEPVRKNADGDLVLSASLRQKKPLIQQDGKPIDGGYVVHGKEVSFEVAKYDATKPLVIDPVFLYSTYLGGSSGDIGQGIAVDGAGNAYVTGYTFSTNFPTTNPVQAGNGGGNDVFVTKINAAGSARVYSTYLGGTGTDIGNAIAVDGSGNAYVTGYTTSTDFPTAKPLQGGNRGLADAFVTKINAAGSVLMYSTYLGGSGDDQGMGIAVDASGNSYVTGWAQSTDFPTTSSPFQAGNGGGMDAFVTKINAAGSAQVYSTYLGGGGDDQGNGIAVDGAGNAYVTGYTFSTNFPITNSVIQAGNGGNSDAFATKINSAGSALVYSTYLGGSGFDSGNGIAVDSSGSAYLTGYTGSANFPTTNPLQAGSGGGNFDVFVAKINAAGSARLYSTYLGGNGDDSGNGVAVDQAGNAYVSGFTNSTNFPTTNPLQAGNGGDYDMFLTKINASGSASVYSTYLGGSLADVGRGIAVDGSGNAYVTGYTTSTDFPTTNPLQAGNGGSYDAFVLSVSGNPPTSKVGIFNSTQAVFLLDANGNFTWDGSPPDRLFSWGTANHNPKYKVVVGDWNGSGKQKVGLFDPATATWMLDYNGNGTLNKVFQWGAPGDLPVVGDWNGSGTTKVGIMNPTQAVWLLDYNGNFIWDGPGVDKQFSWGSPGDTPVVGDWNGSGTTKIGIMNPSQAVWYLDYNGNFTWDGPNVDKLFDWGSPGDIPVVGDWNGSGTTKVGIMNPSQAVWYLDYNGSFTWDGPGVDKVFDWGSPGDIPVVGDWNGSGKTKIGIMNPNQAVWYLDYNGSFTWDGPGVDKLLSWGSPGDTPVVGRW